MHACSKIKVDQEMVIWCPATWELPPPTRAEDKMISRMQAAGSSMERSLLRGKLRAQSVRSKWKTALIGQKFWYFDHSGTQPASSQPMRVNHSRADESNDEAGGCSRRHLVGRLGGLRRRSQEKENELSVFCSLKR
jgi:hypothetical protein